MQSQIPLPLPEASKAMMARSFAVWSNYLSKAKSSPLSWESLSFKEMLARVPAIPDAPLKRHDRSCFGRPKWTYDQQGNCGLNILYGQKRHVVVTTSRPAECTTENESFSRWDTEFCNYTAILTFAWSYILCSRLVELQGGALSYTGDVAPLTSDALPQDGDVITQINTSDAVEVQWWRSLLACGWSAIVDSYFLPWSVTYHGPQRFILQVNPSVVLDDIPLECPSAHQALDYLASFCSFHDLRGQANAALAAALVLPLHSLVRQPVTLPKVCARNQHLESIGPLFDFKQQYSQLSRLITLSCTPTTFSSILWGVFWEPGVDCNLVSEWYYSITQVLKPILEKGDYDLLAGVLQQRRPKLAPLWLGSIITGFTPRRILRFLEGLGAEMDGPDPVAAAWTTTAQSFFHIPGIGDYVENSTIQRSDVYRLLHDCHKEYDPPEFYRSQPLTAFAPMGRVPIESLDLEIRPHLSCRRHNRRYYSWIWTMEDGSTVEDRGLNTSEQELLPNETEETAIICGVNTESATSIDLTDVDINRRASEVATEYVFRWTAHAGFNPAIDPYIPPDYENDESLTESSDEVDRSLGKKSLDFISPALSSYLDAIDDYQD